MNRAILICLSCFALFVSTASAADLMGLRESNGKKGVKVTGDVYKGDKRSFKKAATIDYETVFEAIPVYQKIKKDGIKPDTAEYAFLIREANKVFKSALNKLAKEGGYDLIVEKGGIKVREEEIADITDEVVEEIDSE